MKMTSNPRANESFHETGKSFLKVQIVLEDFWSGRGIGTWQKCRQGSPDSVVSDSELEKYFWAGTGLKQETYGLRGRFDTAKDVNVESKVVKGK